MSWTTKVLAGAKAAAATLGNSVVYIKTKFGVSPTDAQVDKTVAAAEKAAADIAAILEALMEGTGAPPVLAHLGAQVALHVVDAGIAGMGQVVKDNN